MFFKKETISSPDCMIQVPSKTDLAQMKQMAAGIEKEDQRQRLQNMTVIIQKSDLPIMTTDNAPLSAPWLALFKAIDEQNKEGALELLAQLAERDPFLKAILAIHPQEYLKKIISYSIAAKEQKEVVTPKEWPDVVITPKTFEIVIKDIITTLSCKQSTLFSFGLPTHHAYGSKARGFCLINKTAILMKYKEQSSSKKLKHVIVGTDINQDDGLCDILKKQSELDTSHVDMFDTRVYPYNGKPFGADSGTLYSYFNHKVGHRAEGAQEILYWSKKGGKCPYYAVDLSLMKRHKNELHPALNFALKVINSQLADAKKSGQQIVLYLPTGWDSHQNETAFCSKPLGREMTNTELNHCRFNDQDLITFYEAIFSLLKENKEHIAGLYWGLEGGYERSMYEKQVSLLLTLINKHLIPQNVAASKKRARDNEAEQEVNEPSSSPEPD